MDGDITSYSWLRAESMLADILRKEMHLPPAMEDVILKDVFYHPKTFVNEVKAVGAEIRITNFRNR